METIDAAELKARIIQSLQSQGFITTGDKLSVADDLSKDRIRELNQQAHQHKIDQAEKKLRRYERYLFEYIACGEEIVPSQISPRLVPVLPHSRESLLFHYASLHWSIPVSTGIGRRFRFLVMDDYNKKLIGLIGLSDPVFNVGVRDRWIGWDKEKRSRRLRNVLSANILGAVPPYSFLLCGKLVAMLAASNEIREVFRNRYEGIPVQGMKGYVPKKLGTHSGQLALITTTSAYGRSSMYNRIKFRDRLLYQSVGYTQGSGSFQFHKNNLSKLMRQFVRANSDRMYTSIRLVARVCLRMLGLPPNWIFHGVSREFFVVPMASNSREFLRGEDDELDYYDQSVDDLFDYFRERWLLPRVSRDDSYKSWNKNEWIFWPDYQLMLW